MNSNNNNLILFNGINVNVIKSRRKTICLTINNDGSATLKAPTFVTNKRITNFLESRKNWIIQKNKIITENNNKYKFKNGGHLLLFGQDIILKNAENLSFKNNTLYVPFNNKNAKTLVINFYKNTLKDYINKQIKIYESLMNLKTNKITITNAKTRYGSCSYNNNLSFSFRLLMCKKEVIDYVIVHELCHFLHKNHSHDFWQAVAKYNSNYKQNNNYLKNNFFIMNIL